MKKRTLTTVLKVSVTLAAIIAIIYGVDLEGVGQTLGRFPVSGLPFILVCLSAALILSSLKWQAILQGLGRSVGFFRLARLFWAGLFFNTFLPGRTGGDVIRAFGLAASDDNRLRSFASVIVDRGLNLLALVVICLIATALDNRIPEELVFLVRLIALLSILAVGLTLGLRRRYMKFLPNQIQQLMRTLDTGSWDLRRCVTIFGLAIGFQTLMVVINLFAAKGLDIPVTNTSLFVAIPLTAMITAIPISINGFGVREAAYATVLSYLGVEPAVAVALSISVTALMIAWSLTGGAVFAISSFLTKGAPIERASGVAQ